MESTLQYPLRTCAFCHQPMLWGADTAERWGDTLHAACACSFDAASQRILAHAKRLGYRTSTCRWCKRDASTLRFITVPWDAWVFAPCRGVRAGEREG